MTADNVIALVTPGAIAWDLAESGAQMCVTTRRAAILFAAERAAADPSWWTPAREAVARARLVHSTVAGARFDGLWDRLLIAVPFGPAMRTAVDALLCPGGRS